MRVILTREEAERAVTEFLRNRGIEAKEGVKVELMTEYLNGTNYYSFDVEALLVAACVARGVVR